MLRIYGRQDADVLQATKATKDLLKPSDSDPQE
jgi:hypothetical protein